MSFNLNSRYSCMNLGLHFNLLLSKPVYIFFFFYDLIHSNPIIFDMKIKSCDFGLLNSYRSNSFFLVFKGDLFHIRLGNKKTGITNEKESGRCSLGWDGLKSVPGTSGKRVWRTECSLPCF